MTPVLDGIRVLDFGRFIAGPYCAALLGDMGAEVIRIEKVSGGEDRFIAPVAETGEGGTFLQVNRNKRGIALDPMSEEGREIVRRLVATADVVVANLPAASLEAMGLDYDSLCAIKPDVILTAVSAYGSTGPYRDRVGFDGIGQVASGAAYMSGSPGQPVRWAAPYVDFATALACAYGTVLALYARRDTGKGQKVEGSLLRSAYTLVNSMLIEQSVLGLDREPTGNRGYQIGPADLFQTSDGGWILVQVLGAPLFRRWVRLVGVEEWLDDPRFATDEDRGQNGAILSERMAAWCRGRTQEAALAELAAARIPAGPVNSPQAALDDPQARESGMFVPSAFPGLPADAPLVAPMTDMSETPAQYVRRAPLLGEDTASVLKDLGYGEDTIRALAAAGVVGYRQEREEVAPAAS